MRALVFILALCPSVALADFVIANRTIRANTIITELDVRMTAGEFPTGFDRVGDVIGQEARVVLYAGRPVMLDSIGPPAIVTRNQIVQLKYLANGLRITTEGRALERGAVGDRIRIMNLSSRSTLFGQVDQDGSVKVLK